MLFTIISTNSCTYCNYTNYSEMSKQHLLFLQMLELYTPQVTTGYTYNTMLRIIISDAPIRDSDKPIITLDMYR